MWRKSKSLLLNKKITKPVLSDVASPLKEDKTEEKMSERNCRETMTSFKKVSRSADDIGCPKDDKRGKKETQTPRLSNTANASISSLSSTTSGESLANESENNETASKHKRKKRRSSQDHNLTHSLPYQSKHNVQLLESTKSIKELTDTEADSNEYDEEHLFYSKVLGPSQAHKRLQFTEDETERSELQDPIKAKRASLLRAPLSLKRFFSPASTASTSSLTRTSASPRKQKSKKRSELISSSTPTPTPTPTPRSRHQKTSPKPEAIDISSWFVDPSTSLSSKNSTPFKSKSKSFNPSMLRNTTDLSFEPHLALSTSSANETGTCIIKLPSTQNDKTQELPVMLPKLEEDNTKLSPKDKPIIRERSKSDISIPLDTKPNLRACSSASARLTCAVQDFHQQGSSNTDSLRSKTSLFALVTHRQAPVQSSDTPAELTDLSQLSKVVEESSLATIQTLHARIQQLEEEKETYKLMYEKERRRRRACEVQLSQVYNLPMEDVFSSGMLPSVGAFQKREKEKHAQQLDPTEISEDTTTKKREPTPQVGRISRKR